MSLTAAELSPLLDILQNPDHPAFHQALERLTTFNPQGMQGPETAALLARIDATLGKLAAESRLTATELTRLRTNGKALQSYGKLK